MRIRVLYAALLLTFVVWGSLSFVTLSPAQAAGGCTATYTVQRGDWLAAIARRHHTSVYELIQLNPWLRGRINWIYPGQVLCVSAQESPPPAPTHALTLEAEYLLQPGENVTVAIQAPLPSYRRSTIKLQATEPVSLTGEAGLANLITGQSAPMMVAVRNAAGLIPANDFTLYAIGTPALFDGLRLDSTKPLNIPPGCNGTPLDSAFGMQAPESLSLTAWIENGDNRLPIHVSAVGVVPPDQLGSCTFMDGSNQSLLSFALQSTSSSPPTGQLFMQVYDPRTGPYDSFNWYAACEALRQQGIYIC